MSAEFVANMEDVLDLYAEPYDLGGRWFALSFDPVVGGRPALPPRPGIPLRQLEYRREGVRNLFLACEPWRPFRQGVTWR